MAHLLEGGCDVVDEKLPFGLSLVVVRSIFVYTTVNERTHLYPGVNEIESQELVQLQYVIPGSRILSVGIEVAHMNTN